MNGKIMNSSPMSSSEFLKKYTGKCYDQNKTVDLTSILSTCKKLNNIDLRFHRIDEISELADDMKKGINFALVKCLSENIQKEDIYFIEIPAAHLSESEDFYYLRPDEDEVVCIYYNPDSLSNGQFVEMHFSYELIKNTIKKMCNVDDFFNLLYENAKTYLIDKGTDEFAEYKDKLIHHQPDFKRGADLSDFEVFIKLEAVIFGEYDKEVTRK